MADKIPFDIATKARALGFRVDRTAWTIDKLPVRGGAFEAVVSGSGGSQLLAFGSPALIAGSLLASAALNRRQMQVVFTAADGRRSTRIVPASRSSVVPVIGDWIHNLAVPA